MIKDSDTLEAIVARSLKLKSTLQRGQLRRPADALIRAVTALVAEKVLPGGEAAYLKSLTGDDATRMLLRAATAGAQLSDSNWAGVLAQNAVRDFLLSIGPISAAAALMARSNQFQFGPDMGTILPAGILPGAITGGFVEEGQPIPLKAWGILGEPLNPKKMGFISSISRELAKRSHAETLVKDVMEQSAALTFDAHLFNDNAASGAAPAGLLHNAIDLSGSWSYAADQDQAAVLSALTLVAGAVAPVAAGDIVIVAAPKAAVRLQLHAPASPYPILASSGLPEGTVTAVAPRALAFAVGAVPEMAVSNDATIHMSDSPDNIGTVGSPNVVAAPVSSMFQLDLLAIRLLLQVSWSKRTSGAVAFIGGFDW